MTDPDPRMDALADETARAYAQTYGRLSTNLGFLAGRLLRLSMREADAVLDDLGLAAPPRYSLLELAVHTGGINQRALATRLRMDPSGIVALVDELSGLGLVQRNPDPSDRRRVLITGTPAGRALVDVANNRLEAAYRAVLDRLPEDDRAPFLRSLQALTADPAE